MVSLPPFHFAIYHGNERWILRGLAVDIELQLIQLGFSVCRKEILFHTRSYGDPPNALWHIFVHPHQMRAALTHWSSHDLANRSICIFTHYDATNIDVDLLNSIHLVSYMSSHQMAIALANGLRITNSFLQPLGVDPLRHFPIQTIPFTNAVKSLYPQLARFKKRDFIGICTRLTSKQTYLRRKNYPLLLESIKYFSNAGHNILIIGDGWVPNKFRFPDNVLVFDPPYEHYNLFYNFMSIYLSVTAYDGGPMPLLESMSAGVYPVITNSGFAPDVVSHVDHGTLFQPYSDFSVVSSAVSTALKFVDRSSIKLRPSLRERATRFSFKEYSIALANKLGL